MLRISSFIREDREFGASVECIAEAERTGKLLPIVINGLAGGAHDAYLVESAIEIHRIRGAYPTLLVENDEAAERVLSVFLSAGIDAVQYKHRDFVFNNISASHDVDRERLSVLHRLLSGDDVLVVASVPAALQYTMPSGVLDASSLVLEASTDISPEELTVRLSNMGFKATDTVEGVGAFARRGGIVDFFPVGEYPVRAEFFGDEIDRLVYFDPVTQRTVDTCTRVGILPSREVLVSPEGRLKMQKETDVLLQSSELSCEIRERLLHERTVLSSGLSCDFADRYFGVVYDRAECLFDYIEARGSSTYVIIGTSAVAEAAKNYARSEAERAAGFLSYGAATKKMTAYTASFEFFEEVLSKALCVHVNSFAGGVGNMKLSGLFGFRSKRCVSYGDNPRMLLEDVAGLKRGMYRTVLLAQHREGVAPLSDMLIEAGIVPAVIGEDFNISEAPPGTVFIGVGDFSGFELITPRIAVLSLARDTGRAVMSNKRRQRVMRKVGNATKRLMSYADLSVGDYVVHASYGIGLFEGIEAVTIDGVTKDYITIRYAGTDKLFVPCDRLEAISKYIGDRDRDGTVKLSKMGGTEWARTKSRAKAAARDIAKNLIQLYAERQRRPGFAFPPEPEMEDEFDSRFEYEETPSQLTAIEEIKRDMSRPVPMNRLLCGDVGFGKTEVALRAAFRAMLSGKQVALLVPTTILALQHYQTALSRMRGYAINIEMLSRFKKPKERAEIMRRVKNGGVDLLIGTHALLSKQLEFRDLGLLIIDEEQRFGVIQKERLREIAKNVDTLMLSATPIPRTLNMSMSGINDISVLDEAPGERRPVETYVMEHDDGIVFDAIERELARGGQVLYVYNRVEDIDAVAGRICLRFPEARITTAHGKMDKEELEDIWQMLVGGEIDVLVCTTIIETGVDLPNANTLVIENADRFGLSQLHQIRGRVGRSERQAYAFFTYRTGKALSEVAEKRLQAIREFAEFGAGFKIALRDLEIRGAGNLLGSEQHGYIESVGYDLYVKLLNEAVLEERGEDKPREEATIIINLSAHIPESYIKIARSRMEIYKRISYIETEEDKSELTDELIDRFGDVPKPTLRLMDVALAKALAERAGIKKIEERDGRLTFVSGHPKLDIWSEVFAEFPSLAFVGAGSPIIVYRLKKNEDPTAVARAVLSKYVSVMEE